MRKTRAMRPGFFICHRPVGAAETVRKESPMTDDRIFQLPTREIPKKWLNIQPSLPEPVPPMLNPADGKPVPLEAFTPLFPMGLLEQEVSQAAGDHHPRRGAQGLLPVPAHAAHPGEVPGGGPGNPAMIFFKNESVTPDRKPQAEHRHPAGLLQPEGRREEARHGDRAPGSGGARWPLPARTSTSTSTSSWCGRPTSRSRTARS